MKTFFNFILYSLVVNYNIIMSIKSNNDTISGGNKHYMSVFQHSPIFYPSDWNSLYVHTLPSGYNTKLCLTKLLETQLCIGIVKRIDLVQKKHKDGEVQYDGYSAFIHFTHWFQNANVDYLRNSIAGHGVCDVSGVIVSKITGIGFVDSFGKPVYIRFSKNTKPLPEIEFNSQQLSEKLVVAENTIIQQQLALTKLDDQMTKVLQMLSELTSVQSEHARLDKLEHQMAQVMQLLTNILSPDETLAKPDETLAKPDETLAKSDETLAKSVYTGPPGFESDDEKQEEHQENSDSSIDDDKLLETLNQEPDESEYVNVSGIVDFDAFILEQQEREHFRIDELKTENTFWSKTVFSDTSSESKYPQKH